MFCVLYHFQSGEPLVVFLFRSYYYYCIYIYIYTYIYILQCIKGFYGEHYQDYCFYRPHSSRLRGESYYHENAVYWEHDHNGLVELREHRRTEGIYFFIIIAGKLRYD